MLDSRYASERFSRQPQGLWDEVEDVARELIPTRDAAFMLNVSEATLRGWAKAAGMRRTDDEADKRTRNWYRTELQHLADLHHRKLGRPPAEPEPSRRMRELEAKVARMEERLAELEARAAGILPRVNAATTQQDGAGESASDDQVQLRELRRKRILARHTADTPLPDGWMAFSSWGQLHDLNKRSMDRYVASGRVEQPTRGTWINPTSGQHINRAYSPEQRATADAQLAAILATRDTQDAS